MARFAFGVPIALLFVISAPSILYGQGSPVGQPVAYPAFDAETYTAVGTGTSIFTGGGIVYHTIAWTSIGTTNPTTCTVELDGSTSSNFLPTTQVFTLIPASGTLSCATAGVAQVAAPAAAQYVRVNITAFTCTLPCVSPRVAVTYLGYTSNPMGTQTSGMPVVAGVGKYQTSNSAVYVSAFNGGNGGCAAINFAITNVFFPGQPVVVDLAGDQPCVLNPIPPSCTSTVFIGPGATYHLQTGSSTWKIPNRCKIIFTGQGTVFPNLAASIVAACSGGSTNADATCAGTTFPNSTQLACFAGIDPSAGYICGSTSYSGGLLQDSVIVGGTFDCRYISGCIGIQNYIAEENSGVFGSAIIGWGVGGIGLDIGYTTTASVSSGNSTYEHLNIVNNQLLPPLVNCTPAAMGIQVNGGSTGSSITTSFPRKISDVTIANTGAGTTGCMGAGNFPNYGIRIAGGSGIVLSSIHIEHVLVAGIDVGLLGSSNYYLTSAVSIDEVSCANTFSSGSGDCILISKLTGGSVNATSIVMHSISASNAQYVIEDQNNKKIPTSTGTGVVAEYITDQSGNVHSDSSYVNSPVLGNPLNLGFANTTNSILTTIQPVVPSSAVTLMLPNASGTFAISASAPLSVNATTGNITASMSNGTGTELMSAAGSFAPNDILVSDTSNNATDSTVAIFNAGTGAGANYALLPIIFYPQSTGTGQVVESTANNVRVIQFVLPYKLVVGHISAGVLMTSSGHFNIGIYSASGSKLVDSGSLSCGTVAIVTGSVTQVTLQPGVYYEAVAATDVTCQLGGLAGSTNISSLFNAVPTSALVALRVGTAANTLSSGSLPTMLGTITSGSTPVIYALIEP